MRTPHDPRPTRPRARRALPPGWLAAAAWALAPLLLASCTEGVAANCPPLSHSPILTVARANKPCAAQAGEASAASARRLAACADQPAWDDR